MGRYLLLWLIGVPLPLLVLIFAFGGLQSEYKKAATPRGRFFVTLSTGPN
jgi:hypothetical protein